MLAQFALAACTSAPQLHNILLERGMFQRLLNLFGL